jgi:methylglyoxal synthase
MTDMIPGRKRIALVAHDGKKVALAEWADFNRDVLAAHQLIATGDQQIGARITEQTIDMLIFFWDPLEPQPHDPDVKALLRIASVWNIPVATNLATADFLISSELMHTTYERAVPDYGANVQRTIPERGAAQDPTQPS